MPTFRSKIFHSFSLKSLRGPLFLPPLNTALIGTKLFNGLGRQRKRKEEKAKEKTQQSSDSTPASCFYPRQLYILEKKTYRYLCMTVIIFTGIYNFC